MSENTVRVSVESAKSFIKELFVVAGLSGYDAAFHADALVKSNLWGIDSHGVIRVPAYFNRMLNGAINTKPDIKTIRGEGALVVLDADRASGFIGAKAGMQKAITLAKTNQIAAVGVVNSNHFGAGALYARMAADQGMIGICMTNVLPLIVAPGAKKPVVGNNPLAIAIPTYGDFPFCLDMSMSKVAGGKLTLAIKKGEKIPMDWATDSEGNPTDDPTQAFNGYLLPMGDFKGLGLAYFVDIMAGLVTGGVFAQEMKSMYANPTESSLTGHFMIAINISSIIGKDEMMSRMERYYQQLKQTPMLDPAQKLYLPGEIEYRRQLVREKEGLPIPLKTIEELEALASQHQIKTKLEIMN
jgi:LDH2 family malate/lactate/ureidoglycolate dehydrogenase